MGKTKDTKAVKAVKAKAAPAKAAAPVKAAATKVEKSAKEVPKKAGGKKSKKVESESESESDSESEASASSDEDSESDSDVEMADAPKAKANGGVKVAVETSDSSDSDSDEEEEEVKKPVKAAKAANGKVEKKAESDSDDSEDDSSAAASDDSDSSEEESDSAEEKPAVAEKPSKKRKAEEEPESDEASTKKTKSDGDASEKSATLWVGNLGWGVDDNALYEEFQSYEGIVGARVVIDKESGRSRGFGYVDFGSPDVAEKAYNDKNGSFLQGRDLRLDFAAKPSTDAQPNARAADRARKHGDVISPPSDTLFVGNLPFSADEDSVSNFFNEAAKVQSLRIPTDQESGRAKGFAYVTFSSIDDAKAAFEACNGGDLDGRPVRLDYAKPRDPNGGGGGGGFGGGRGGGRGGFGGGRGGGRGGGGGFGGRGGGRGGFGGDRGGGRGGFGGRGGGRGGGGGFQGKRTTF